MTSFESFDGAVTAPEDRMECGICWHVYDPVVGDEVRQIAAGTAFADLPEDWHCPICDAPRAKFMRLGDERA
jgi:rubredoxin